MPKMKTNRGAAKRFRKNGAGDFKRGQSHRRHILTKKSTKRFTKTIPRCLNACCRTSNRISGE